MYSKFYPFVLFAIVLFYYTQEHTGREYCKQEITAWQRWKYSDTPGWMTRLMSIPVDDDTFKSLKSGLITGKGREFLDQITDSSIFRVDVYGDVLVLSRDDGVWFGLAVIEGCGAYHVSVGDDSWRDVAPKLKFIIRPDKSLSLVRK